MFAPLDGGAGAGHEGILKSCLGRSCERMCTKLYVLITELYGIAGVVNILLDVTFSCVVMWIYVCTRMCWWIVTYIPDGIEG